MDSSAKLHGRVQEVQEGREQNTVLGAADERAPAKHSLIHRAPIQTGPRARSYFRHA